jgi:hypothetical protein
MSYYFIFLWSEHQLSLADYHSKSDCLATYPPSNVTRGLPFEVRLFGHLPAFNCHSLTTTRSPIVWPLTRLQLSLTDYHSKSACNWVVPAFLLSFWLSFLCKTIHPRCVYLSLSLLKRISVIYFQLSNDIEGKFEHLYSLIVNYTADVWWSTFFTGEVTVDFMQKEKNQGQGLNWKFVLLIPKIWQ